MTRIARASSFAFACSGFAGLVYQVVWLRLAFASYGVITPVLSIVVSVFMAGLGIGAVVGARLARARSPRHALFAYVGAELGIAALAPTIKAQLAAGQWALSSMQGASSGAYLFLSGLALALALIVPCTLMGTTYPLMLAAVRGSLDASRGFGRLYLANTVGAAVGALGSVFIIEILGFSATILVGALCNATAAVAALSLRTTLSDVAPPSPPVPPASSSSMTARDPRWLILFTTGFASMAMEVVWSRLFAPVLGHLVYSFASLLCTFLVATTVGAALYRRGLFRMSIDAHVALVTFAALVPVVANDLRVAPAGIVAAVGVFGLRFFPLLTIVPLCLLLGALTPRIIDDLSHGDPRPVARAYAINVAGCVIGPLVASYLILPHVSCALALTLVAAPLALFAGRLALRAAVGGAVVVVGVLAFSWVVTYDDPIPRGFADDVRVIRRDHTATVISTGTGNAKRLVVNGIGLTKLTPITKTMAHLPLLAAKEPKSALVICLGMGTTWRSLMSWPIRAVAVELLPSVVEAMPYYYDDSAKMRADPRGAIIVDDGRRFLERTDEMFDVITLDPPPPLDAAGVGLLYSDEFYALAKRRLKPGGVLQAWIFAVPGSVEMRAIVRSFADAFPHVRAFEGIEGFGIHLLGSTEPVVFPTDVAAHLPASALADLRELTVTGDAVRDLELVVSHEYAVGDLVGSDASLRMTDDLPINEYHWLRDLLSQAQ